MAKTATLSPATRLAIRRGKKNGLTTAGLARQYAVSPEQVREITGETARRSAARTRKKRGGRDDPAFLGFVEAVELCRGGADMWVVWANFQDQIRG